MPYMKTRSVTRKMYTVGATYQAPTKKDETEWKEWPVHGMHERPVYHPQAGLAVEYLGRYFTSLDGLSYYEIIDEPEIEVVAVDPHHDRRASSVEKKPKGKTRVKSRYSSNAKDTWNTYFSAKDKSFETCMHGSLHCVLGYCSQVMTPAYKQAVEEKIKSTVSASKASSTETSAKETTNFKNNATSSSENVAKFAEKAKLIEAIAIAQSVQNKNIMNNANRRRTAATYSSSSATYIPEAQRSIVESNDSKIIPQSGEMIGMNLKRILRDASNSSLILLRNSVAKTSGEDCTAIAKDVFNPAKLEDVFINDKAPTDMSSIYKKLVFASKPALDHEESPTKNNLYTLKRYSKNTRENTTKKTFLENQLENEKTVHATKENRKGKNADKIKISRESNDELLMMSSGKNSTQCASETSEIARILSEYNNSTLRKSAIQSRIYDSRSMKTNMTNLSGKTLPKNFWQKNITAEENQNFTIPDINADLDLMQEKWKRYNPTLGEKTKDNAEIANSAQNARNSCSMSLENIQVPFIDREMSLNTLKYAREKSAKSCKEREIVITEAKLQEGTSEHSKDEINISTTEPLQELLENTAILYCAASGVHQDDLSNYIDTLDSKQSIQWLESWNNSVV
ncbi:pancreas transcription factor 1 subunit alpha [Lasius niger]|uniref:Pancreas transcription factor 1 subunit alpha n=1 Tax=Lasius niger TaxID=67767 RepID=A0A0J7KPH4_LASNI|nr:pancreas transcription factor 1 subunit alpha [Lasius niger]